MQDQQRKPSPLEGRPPTIIFILMVLTNILINLDHGILPACTKDLQAQYDMDEAELGFLGSIVYLGIVVMGLFAGRMYQHINSKILTLVALLALEVCLLLFVLSSQAVFAYISRFLTGACQVFLLVYYPIWIDKFGLHRKTLWLTLLQICVPIGIFVGYGMTALILSFDLSYKISFYIQIGLVALFIAAFVFLSKRKLDSRRKLSEQINEALLPPMRESQITTTSEMTTTDRKKKYEVKEMARRLLKSPMYIVGTLTMSIILFVSTGIQFWLTDYFSKVLNFPKEDVQIAYVIVSITGPTTGCGFGGWVINRIGGYDNQKSVYYVFLFSCIGIGSAVVIPFVGNFIALCILLWLVLFFGGAMMPGLTGIMMSSVAPYLRAFGNSNGEIIKNIFGYLPSPFIYGLFNQLIDNRAGIKFLMLWGLWAPILLGVGSVYKYFQIKRREAGIIDTKDEGESDGQISVTPQPNPERSVVHEVHVNEAECATEDNVN